MMNNSKYYNDSLAHDFELFMPKTKKSPAEIVKMPKTSEKKKTGRSAASKRLSAAISAILIGTFMVAVICAKIVLRVEITEVGASMVEAKNNLSQLSGEETRLNIEFERMISYNNLEDSAKALGMKKMDKNQIVYIRVNDTNKAVDAEGNVLTADNE